MELPAISSMKNSFIAFEWEVSMRKKRDENYLISFINYPAVAPSFFFNSVSLFGSYAWTYMSAIQL